MTQCKPSKMVIPVIALSTLFLFLISYSNTFPGIASKNLKDSDQAHHLANHQNQKAISYSYPDSIHQWEDEIRSAASRYNLDPNLIAAVMLQESGGNPDAYSYSGAVGLMQVMPCDGIAAGFFCGASPCFKNRPTRAELFNPEFNVDYGARMLAGLIQKHENARDALKAYGPMDMAYEYADIVLNIWALNQ